jgi:hypothetical protein
MTTEVIMMNSTTTPRSGSARRVVRRRPAIDRAHDAALADLNPAIRPLVRRYAENMKTGQELRSELTMAMGHHNLHWRDVDPIAHKLAFG